MIGYMRIIRPERSIIAAAAVWIGTLIAGSALIPELNAILAILSAFLIAAGSFAANDYFDAESDKLNRPDRPLARGKASKRKTLALSGILFAAGIALAYFINFDTLAVAAIASGLLIVYSAQLKRTILIGNLVISGLAALAFFFGGVAAGNHLPALPLALFAFLSGAGREIYKNIDSSLADRRYEENSVAIKLGVSNARIIANVFLTVAVIFSFVPYLLGLLGMTYLFFVLMADIAFLASAAVPVKYSSKLVLIGIVIGVFAFLAGEVA